MLAAITKMHAMCEVAPNDSGLFLSQGLCRNGCSQLVGSCPPGSDSKSQVLTFYGSTHFKTLKDSMFVCIKEVKGKRVWRIVHEMVLF